MTEDDAHDWLHMRFGGAAVDQLAALAHMVKEENERQNLIAPASVAQMWNRHLLDSAQLADLAPVEGTWLDIGTGGGFPGVVVAVLRHEPTILVEPRRRRAAFLEEAAERLGLRHVAVHVRKVENVTAAASVISARAVASVEKLLLAALPCATISTRWLLPRGRLAGSEVDALQRRWRGLFHVKQSLSDSESLILVGDGVRLR